MAQNINGWAVGNEEWLDKEESKVSRYWRVIEHGSAATQWPWEGQRIVGLWSNRATPRGGLIQGDLDPFIAGDGRQKFVPFFRKAGQDYTGAVRRALYYFFEGGEANMDLLQPRGSFLRTRSRKNGQPGKMRSPEQAQRSLFFWLLKQDWPDGRAPFVSGVVMNSIPPGDFYRKALLEFNPLERELQAMRDIIQLTTREGEPSTADPTTAAGRRQARYWNAVNARHPSGREVAPRTGPARQYADFQSPFQGGITIAITASAELQDYSRNALGHFTSFQEEIIKVNKRMAKEYADAVADLMEQSGRRVATGNLAKATRDPQNRFPH